MLTLEKTPHALHFLYHSGSGHELMGEAQLHSDGWIWSVEVYEPFRGSGHGRVLVEQLIAQARAMAMPALQLWVDPDNAAAITLYVSLGFEAVGGGGIRGVHMRKGLA